jgi:hypothetical protein
MEIAAISRQYQLFFYGWIRVQTAMSAGWLGQVRPSYYDLEREKQKFDREVLDWRSRCDWMYSDLWEAADGWEIKIMDSWVQKEMLSAQKNFAEFLRRHQDEAFPLTGKHQITAYERLLRQYQKPTVEENPAWAVTAV